MHFTWTVDWKYLKHIIKKENLIIGRKKNISVVKIKNIKTYR